jgi:hypothetical protein
MKSKEIAEFIRNLRSICKFQTMKDACEFGKTRGVEISPEAIRLFEAGERIPVKSSRAILSKMYRMTPEQDRQLEHMCANYFLRGEGYDSSLVVVDTQVLDEIKTLVGSIDDKSLSAKISKVIDRLYI